MKDASGLLTELERLYPDARAELDFTNPFETLIATMLAAQCTDKRVNQVTPALFARYPDAAAMAGADPSELEEYIKSCGLYRSKAKNIIAASAIIVQEHAGAVPREIAELEKLPGVGHKTASVVHAFAFGGDAMPVDTHVFRVSNRLGIANAKDVVKTEEQICAVIPKRLWSTAHHWLILHGRRVCRARKPDCPACTLKEYCAHHGAGGGT